MGLQTGFEDQLILQATFLLVAADSERLLDIV